MPDFDTTQIEYLSDENRFAWQGEGEIPLDAREWVLEHISKTEVQREDTSYIQYRFQRPKTLGHPISKEAYRSLKPETAPSELSPSLPGPSDENINYGAKPEFISRQVDFVDEVVYPVDVPLIVFLSNSKFYKEEFHKYLEAYHEKAEDVTETEQAISKVYRGPNGQFLSFDDPKVRPLRVNSFYIKAKFRVIVPGVAKDMTRWIQTNFRVKGRGQPKPLTTWNDVYNKCWRELLSKLDEMSDKYEQDLQLEQLVGRYGRYGEQLIASKMQEMSGPGYTQDIPR